VLAFDLGGGTLDLSLMECKAGHLKVKHRVCAMGFVASESAPAAWVDVALAAISHQPLLVCACQPCRPVAWQPICTVIWLGLARVAAVG